VKRRGGLAAWAAVGPMALGVLASGCGDGGAGSGLRSEVRDSAGIVIVENQAPPADLSPLWTLAEAPALDIGVLEGEDTYQLFQVRDARRLDDGRILVANGGSQEVRVFDAAGVFLTAFGQAGDGPGEFRYVASLEILPGDSILVWDRSHSRLSVFGPAFEFARSFSLAGTETAPRAQFLDLLGDGRIVGGGTVTPDMSALPPTGVSRFDVTRTVHDLSGAVTADLGTHPGAERFIRAGGGTISVWVSPMYRTAVALGWRGDVVIATNDAYRFQVYGPDGTLTRVVRMDHPPVPVTDADRSAYVETQVRDLDDERARAVRADLADVTWPDTHPAYGTVLVDALDRLWVEDYRRPGDDSAPTWTVFDPDGRVLGKVGTPAGLVIHEIGADYVLGRAPDDLDVEHVQLWEVR